MQRRGERNCNHARVFPKREVNLLGVFSSFSYVIPVTTLKGCHTAPILKTRKPEFSACPRADCQKLIEQGLDPKFLFVVETFGSRTKMQNYHF